MAHEFAQYQPSDEIAQRMQVVQLVAMVGPSMVGKTTLMEHARQQDPSLHFVVSDVSRVPRVNETEGAHFYFHSLQAMEARARAGLYATIAPHVTGDLYATLPDEYDQHGRPVMAVLASVMPSFRKLFPAMRTIVVLPPSFEAWMARQEERNNQAKRMAEAVESLNFAANDDQSFFVINDDLDAAKAECMRIIKGDLTSQAAETQAQGRHLAAALLRRVETN